MEADLLEMQCAVLAALQEVTGVCCIPETICIELWSGATQEPACRLPCLWGPGLCQVLLQQRRAAGLAQLHIVYWQHAAMLVGTELHVVCSRSRLLQPVFPTRADQLSAVPQMMPQMVSWAAECRECQWTLLAVLHLAHSALPSTDLQLLGPNCHPKRHLCRLLPLSRRLPTTSGTWFQVNQAGC